MQTTIDTSDVRPTDRSDYFREAVRGMFGSCDLLLAQDAPMNVQIAAGQLGGLSVSISRGPSGVSVFRTPSDVRRCGRDFLDMLFVRAGACSIIQNDEEVHLEAGEAAFLVSTRPYEIHKRRQRVVPEIVEVSVPFQRIRDSVPRPDLLAGRRLPRAAGFAALAEDLVLLTADAPEDFSARAGDSLVGALEVLIAKLTRGEGGGGLPHLMTLKRARMLALENLHDFELDRNRLAAGLNLSVRHLSRMLAQSGETPATLIRRLRLAKARALLGDARHDGLSIMEVALSVGYASHSQFSRDFRASFGLTPREARMLGCGTEGSPGRSAMIAPVREIE